MAQKPKIDYKQLNKYFSKISKGLKVQVGFFAKYSKKRQILGRKEVGEGTKDTKAYGVVRNKSSRQQKSLNGQVVTNAMVALQNIRGRVTEKYTVPKRNFFAMAGNKKYWQGNKFSFLKKYYKSEEYGGRDNDEVPNRLGNLGKTIVKRAITDFHSPANTEFTINKKGFNKPLVETGQLRDGVGFRIPKVPTSGGNK